MCLGICTGVANLLRREAAHETEAAVFVTQQPDGEVRADTVGVPSPGVELRIDDKGEVYYRSPGVFLGYYKNDEATKATKTRTGS